jgi:hypothetical protein
MYDDHYQAMKETAGAIFYAMLSLYDDAAERESVQLLKDMKPAPFRTLLRDPFCDRSSGVPERWPRERGAAPPLPPVSCQASGPGQQSPGCVLL